MLNKEIMDELGKPFPKEKIKHRRGRGGDVEYIESTEIVKRLNAALDGEWSFTIESDKTESGFIIVLGKIEIAGIVKMQYGRKKITTDKQGAVVDPGDDSKAAAADALKKCASLFGVNLDLYSENGAPDKCPTGNGKPETGGQGTSPDGDEKQADKSADAEPANLGEAKNSVMKKEKELKEKFNIVPLEERKAHLGNETLDHTKASLRKYYEHLQGIEKEAASGNPAS